MNQAIRLYFGAGRGGGGGRKSVLGGGGGGGVKGTYWLFNGHGSNEVTRDITAYISLATAGQLWHLWQLTWAVIAHIGYAITAELWQL